MVLHLVNLRGIDLRNLNHAKYALMDFFFVILNSKNKLWINIFNNKYGPLNVWNWNLFSKSSWFYKSICKYVDLLKTNFCIISCNPGLIDFIEGSLFNGPSYSFKTYLHQYENWFWEFIDKWFVYKWPVEFGYFGKPVWQQSLLELDWKDFC